MTPMREKFYQKRFEEQSTVFSYSNMLEGTQKEHYGLKRFVPNPAHFCSVCGVTDAPCECSAETIIK